MKEVATLNTGASFGELALMSSKPRAATIYCKENWLFAVLNREDYQHILGKLEQK